MSSSGDGAKPGADPHVSGGALLDQLFRTEGGQLVRFLHRRTGDREEARDLVQEAFARLARALATGLSGRPEAYLQRIARNLLFDRARREKTRASVQHVPIDCAREAAVPPEQDWAIEAGDLMRRFQAALDRLPERTREVFLLHRVEDLGYAEIAARLGLTTRVVEYHVAKALLHLHRTLDPE